MDQSLTYDLFIPYVGERFSFEGCRVSLTLASVKPSPALTIPDPARAPFGLIFHGPASEILLEGIYRAATEDGSLTVGFYIIPIHTAAADRQDYQVVFN
jgi:hypothetical protein